MIERAFCPFCCSLGRDFQTAQAEDGHFAGHFRVFQGRTWGLNPGILEEQPVFLTW